MDGIICQRKEGTETLGGGSEGAKTDGGAPEITEHAIQGGSSNGVTLLVWELGCDIHNDGGAGGFPP